MIDTIQIQTYEKCNAKCIMCPRDKIYQSKLEMTNRQVERLAYMIGELQPSKIKDKCRVIMNFQNEPLLDSLLIDKIKIIKSFVNCNVDLYTNGILFDKYKQDLIDNKKYIGGIIYSNYGNDLKKWQHITRVKLTKDEFDNMKKAISEIEKYITVRYWDAWDGDKLYSFSSRAGLTKEKKLKTYVNGCKWKRPYKYLHIYSNGDIVLCCQDWKRETKFGNVFLEGLEDILNKKHYHDIMEKAIGKKKSDINFICKRCQFNIRRRE